jgi:1,4-alpha-glucan branching enzyme
MGSSPYDGGTAFRVWAPNAQSVAVKGDFNNWSDTANPLTSEGNGYWSTDVTGAKVGQEYRYVIRNGALLSKNDPYTRKVTSTKQFENSVIHSRSYSWPDQPFEMPPWNELVIYELHVGTFGGGTQPPDRFKDAKARLPYLRDLGVNAILIMAAGEFETDTSLGYNPAYIFAIEESYGGIDAFQDFVKAARENGIAVIFDVVYNHFGAAGLGECLWHFDGWFQDDGGGIYFYNDWRRHTQWGDRPDFGRGEVRQYIRDNALAWLDDLRVDGLRFDATNQIRNVSGNGNSGEDLPDGWGLMQWINSEVDARFSWKITIAEDMQNNEWITKTTGEGGAGFDSQWDAVFMHALRGAIVTSWDSDRNMDTMRDIISSRFNGDAVQRVIYTESHDEVRNGHARVPEEIWPGNAGSWHSKKRSTLGAGIVFTAPGIPMIFQGQEFLEDGGWSDEDMLDWNKVISFAGIHKMYRDMIRLRRNWWNNTRGLHGQNVNVHHLNNTDKLIAYHRWDEGGPGDDVLVVANFSAQSFSDYVVGVPRGGSWKLRFNSDWNGYDSQFGSQPAFDVFASPGDLDGLSFTGHISIAPYTLLIFSQDS